MRAATDHIESIRDAECSTIADGFNGLFRFNPYGTPLKIMVSDGGDWDHVSVSCEHRTPNWKEMCYVKNMFFGTDEWVVQYHPAKEHVNCPSFVLHMWKPQKETIPTPPGWMV